MEEKVQIPLGSKVKDVVTGFEGTVTARVKYMNGCIQYCVEPKVDKEGKKLKHEYVDFNQLKVIKSSAKKTTKKSLGGVMPNAPEY